MTYKTAYSGKIGRKIIAQVMDAYTEELRVPNPENDTEEELHARTTYVKPLELMGHMRAKLAPMENGPFYQDVGRIEDMVLVSYALGAGDDAKEQWSQVLGLKAEPRGVDMYFLYQNIGEGFRTELAKPLAETVNSSRIANGKLLVGRGVINRLIGSAPVGFPYHSFLIEQGFMQGKVYTTNPTELAYMFYPGN